MTTAGRVIGSTLQGLVWLIVAAVLTLMLWGGYTITKRRPVVRAAIASARVEAPRLMDTLSARPGVVAVGSRSEEVMERRSTRITETQLCDAPGPFSATADYYIDRLTRDGWRVVQRSDGDVEFTKSGWDLRLEEDGLSDLPQPSCRYTLRLTWSSRSVRDQPR